VWTPVGSHDPAAVVYWRTRPHRHRGDFARPSPGVKHRGMLVTPLPGVPRKNVRSALADIHNRSSLGWSGRRSSAGWCIVRVCNVERAFSRYDDRKT
jgi:hypothetical protein